MLLVYIYIYIYIYIYEDRSINRVKGKLFFSERATFTHFIPNSKEESIFLSQNLDLHLVFVKCHQRLETKKTCLREIPSVESSRITTLMMLSKKRNSYYSNLFIDETILLHGQANMKAILDNSITLFGTD